MSGYTIGDETLYDNCKSLSAGQYLMIVDDKLEVFDYFKYFDAISKQSYDELKTELTRSYTRFISKNHKQNRRPPNCYSA